MKNAGTFIRCLVICQMAVQLLCCDDRALGQSPVLKTLLTFNGTNGSHPQFGLSIGNDGALYGATLAGGLGDGVVFKIGQDGNGFAIIKYFTGGHTDGSGPVGVLAQGNDNFLYGATMAGGGLSNGSAANGTAFRINHDGSVYSVILNMSSGNYINGVVLGTNGTLYGSAQFGPGAGYGEVFSLSTNGSGFDAFVQFPGTAGKQPMATVLQADDGFLYGTTSGSAIGDGTIYKASTNGTQFQSLWTFSGYPNDGSQPVSPIIEGHDSVLYGTYSRWRHIWSWHGL